MIGKLKAILAALVVACAFGLAAAPAAKGPAQKIPNNFRRPVPASLKALKASVGRPFDKGWVFIDGKFVLPPYKVERYGTVLRINGFQISNDVISWQEFIKTQAGAVATKTEAPAGGDAPAAGGGEDDLWGDSGSSSDDEADDDDDDDDSSSALDDLFDDDPKPKKKEKKAKKKKSSFKARPKKPVATVTYSFDGEFVPNEKSNALLARIDKARERIDARLRSGGIVAVSARYASVSIDGGAVATDAMAKLPELMRRAETPEDLYQSVRNSGLVFFSAKFCADLFRYKTDYLAIQARAKKMKDAARWDNL